MKPLVIAGAADPSTHGGCDARPATVSVIIPTYNHARYVGDAVDSVLRQTYQDFELIVIDDGSTDDSRDVIARFGSRLRYVRQENRGLAAARNTGLAIAGGELVALLDADDLYEPEFLLTLVELLRAQPHAGAAYCGYRFVDESNRPLPQIESRVTAPDAFHQALLQGNFLVPEAVLVRRRSYESVGSFDESLSACEDWDMWLRLSRHHQFVGTPVVLTRHRVAPGSMSADPHRMLANRLRVLEKIFGPSPARNLADRRAYARAYLSGCIEYLQARQEHQAFGCLVKMADACPELLAEDEPFYELGCGAQPKGCRGHFATVDVEHNAHWLLGTLERLFRDPHLSPRLRAYRRRAYGHANFALGRLSYGARRLPETRRYLLRAVAADPLHAINRQLIAIFIKSLALQAGIRPRTRVPD